MLEVNSLVKWYPDESARPGRSSGVARARRRVGAVGGVSFTVPEGQLFTLLGPSGCGKSTTLRCIAGLETPDSGEIRMGDRVLFDGSGQINVSPKDRGFGMVFQSYAIWPHMNVFENAAFGLKVRGRRERMSRERIQARVQEVLRVTQLELLESRSATALSGGQQQRLALARAMVMEPQLMLLDEPLSNLDASLRSDMRMELKRLQNELGLTSIYVTHDQSEALALSDQIAVMQGGRIRQLGTPREIYEAPSCRFVAEFIGTANLFEGRVEQVTSEGSTVSTNIGPIVAASPQSLGPGDEAVVVIRPEHIVLSHQADSEDTKDLPANQWIGRVVACLYLGDSVETVVMVDGHEFKCQQGSWDYFAAGETVLLKVDPRGARVLPSESGENDLSHVSDDSPAGVHERRDSHVAFSV